MDKLNDAIEAQVVLEAQTYQRAACDMLRKAAHQLAGYNKLHVLGEMRAALLGHAAALSAVDEIMREVWLEWRNRR